MARRKTANSGTKNNKTQITTIPANQSEYEYKHDIRQDAGNFIEECFAVSKQNIYSIYQGSCKNLYSISGNQLGYSSGYLAVLVSEFHVIPKDDYVYVFNAALPLYNHSGE